jgi:glucose-6-phosphate 1-epimerase
MAAHGEAPVTLGERGGAPALRLRTDGGARAEVSVHGAQLVSWRPAGGREWIFLSERADFAVGKAIRGGVPICFPQFAALGPLPKHGLVRTRRWSVVEQGISGGAPRVVLGFDPDAEVRALWPRPCRVECTVRLEDDRVALELAVRNLGDAPLSFTAALHGYFAVGDVEAVEVTGLQGVEYRDAADGDRLKVERGSAVAIRGEVDRVYHAVPGDVVLREPGRALALRAEGFPDVVVWNPGAAKCAALPDMAPDGWRRMLCVEAGAIRTPVLVAPGATWRGRQLLSSR